MFLRAVVCRVGQCRLAGHNNKARCQSVIWNRRITSAERCQLIKDAANDRELKTWLHLLLVSDPLQYTESGVRPK